MAHSVRSLQSLGWSNTKSCRRFAYPAKNVDALQLMRRPSHSKKLDWHRGGTSVVAGDSEALQTNIVLETSSASLTEPNASSNSEKAISLSSIAAFEKEKVTSMEKLIVEIKDIFDSMEDGEISPSAYDTAWMARVPNIDGSCQPHFPQSLEWIVHNQLADGSWGDARRFLASDRFLNTLACLITLTIWNTGHIQVQRGIDFIMTHAEILMREALGDHGVLKGFEMVFPVLLNEAKLLGVDLSDYNSSVLKQTNEKRESELKKVSTEELHAHPSSLLYYIEGIQELIDWQKILKLQSRDGSFVGSPSSTACVYMHTGNKKCLQFLTGLLTKFEDHVPCMYPVDISERLRAVDTVERLGLERHFQEEIKQALDYVFKYWNPNGLGFGRESLLPDLEITANGLRLLRMYGYKVSSDVLEKMYSKLFGYKNFGGVLDVLSLYKCSHLKFPGEKVMAEVRTFAKDYLAKSLQSNDFPQVQAVKKNLKEEIEYGLLYPWNKTMPRLMYRNYIEHFSSDDLWQGKILYYMPNVSNEKYIELARLDFNSVQALHREEISEINRWYKENDFPQLKFPGNREVALYWAASAVMFEPEYSACRVNYAKAAIMVGILDDLYDSHASVRQANILNEAVKRWHPSLIENLPDDMKICFMGLYNTLNDIGEKGRQFYGRDVLSYLTKAWETLLLSFTKELEWAEAQYSPSLEEYWKNAVVSVALGVITLTPVFSTGEPLPEDLLAEVDFRAEFLNLVCFASRIVNDVRTFKAERDRGEVASCVQCYMNDHPGFTEEEALNYMQNINEEALDKLNYELLKPDSNIPKWYRMLLFNTARVAQLFYKNIDGLRNSEEMEGFIKKCLFEPV